MQKVLSSHAIYYASTWLLCNYQVNKLERILRDFLWLDGQGNKKRHNASWDWCCTLKERGGLGLRDLKTHGIAIATKWIFKSIHGNEPWKVLIRNNIFLSKAKKGRNWSNLGFFDMLLGGFDI